MEKEKVVVKGKTKDRVNFGELMGSMEATEINPFNQPLDQPKEQILEAVKETGKDIPAVVAKPISVKGTELKEKVQEEKVTESVLPEEMSESFFKVEPVVQLKLNKDDKIMLDDLKDMMLNAAFKSRSQVISIGMDELTEERLDAVVDVMTLYPDIHKRGNRRAAFKLMVDFFWLNFEGEVKKKSERADRDRMKRLG